MRVDYEVFFMIITPVQKKGRKMFICVLTFDDENSNSIFPKIFYKIIAL